MAKFSDNKKKVVNLFFNRRKERRSRYNMALKNVNIPLNIQDYPTMNDNSSSVYMGVNSLLNNSSDNQNLVTITNYLPSDQSSVNISKMINGIIVGPTTILSNIQNSIIVGSINTSSSSLAGSQVGVSNILAAGSYLEIPNASNCAILGVGNDPDVINPLFIIGNGTTYVTNHNIVEVTTNSINLTPANNIALNISGTGVNITGDTTITGDIAVNGLLTIGDEDNGTTTIDMNEITTSSLKTNSIKVRSGDSISIISPVNLNNTTISGGATLTGTYTFDSTGGLKIGSNTINSSNQPITLTMPSQEGTLALNTEYYLYTITLCFYKTTTSTGASGIFTFTGLTNSPLNNLITEDGKKSYSTITEEQLLQIYNNFIFNNTSIHFTASGELRLRETASSGWSDHNITAISYNYSQPAGNLSNYSCVISYIPSSISSTPNAEAYTLYSSSGGIPNLYIDTEHIHNVIISKKTIRSGGGTIVNN